MLWFRMKGANQLIQEHESSSKFLMMKSWMSCASSLLSLELSGELKGLQPRMWMMRGSQPPLCDDDVANRGGDDALVVPRALASACSCFTSSDSFLRVSTSLSTLLTLVSTFWVVLLRLLTSVMTASTCSARAKPMERMSYVIWSMVIASLISSKFCL